MGGDHNINLRVDRHYIYCEGFIQISPGGPPMDTAKLVRRLRELVSKYRRIHYGCGVCYYSNGGRYCGLGMEMVEGCNQHVRRTVW